MMKNFIWCLVIIIITAIVVFCIGWLPLRLSPGSYAVIVSKTGGVKPLVVSPGQFCWCKELILPTNTKILQFNPCSVDRTVDIAGEYPSAKVYSEFMAGKPDFSYQIKLKLSVVPRYSKLPELYQKIGIDSNDALLAYMRSEVDVISSQLRTEILGMAELSSLDIDNLKLKLSQRQDYLDILNIQIVSRKIPDIGLYNEAKNLYKTYVNTFIAAMTPVLTNASEKAASDQVRLDVLEKYGELITKYPGLLDYLAIEAEIERKTGKK